MVEIQFKWKQTVTMHLLLGKQFHFCFQHPEYNQGPGFSPNDIAVVQANAAISGDNISPGTIAPNSDNPGGRGWITGWGRTCQFHRKTF